MLHIALFLLHFNGSRLISQEDDEDEEERKQILGDAPRLKPNPSVPRLSDA